MFMKLKDLTAESRNVADDEGFRDIHPAFIQVRLITETLNSPLFGLQNDGLERNVTRLALT